MKPHSSGTDWNQIEEGVFLLIRIRGWDKWDKWWRVSIWGTAQSLPWMCLAGRVGHLKNSQLAGWRNLGVLDAGFQPHPQKDISQFWSSSDSYVGGCSQLCSRVYCWWNQHVQHHVTAGKIPCQADEIHKLLVESNFCWLIPTHLLHVISALLSPIFCTKSKLDSKVGAEMPAAVVKPKMMPSGNRAYVSKITRLYMIYLLRMLVTRE